MDEISFAGSRSKLRIASIHAHPDDAEILAGGTLALLAEAGHQVTIVTLSAGDCGSGEYAPEDLARIRQEEARASAALIGADYRWGGFSDLAIFRDDPSRRRVTRLLRELRPDIIITACPEDYLCDHEAASQLVRDACFTAPIPNYQVESCAPPLEKIPHLYFMDPLDVESQAGRWVNADFTVEIGSVMNVKTEMLSKHETQRAWLKRQHQIDNYLSQMTEWTRSIGARAGVGFGEGFRHYRVHPYPQSPLLELILGPHVVTREVVHQS